MPSLLSSMCRLKNSRAAVHENVKGMPQELFNDVETTHRMHDAYIDVDPSAQIIVYQRT
jgi:hypothetical protein